MSLAFLAKKSFHTTNLDNVERVWIAEQKAENEAKKLAELQKQIDDERKIQELRQLQVASGQKVKTTDSSLDWMYQGPNASQMEKQKDTEEYLLGKIFKPQKTEDLSDFQKVGQEKAAGALYLNKVNSKNDTFSRLHEDPMLMIRQREKTAREMIINNPVKMARIYSELERQIEGDKEDVLRKSDSHKKSKKDKSEKKQKKEKKSKNRDHDDYRGRDEDKYDHYKKDHSNYISEYTNVKTSDRTRADSRECHTSAETSREYDRYNDERKGSKDSERNRSYEKDNQRRDRYSNRDHREETDRHRHRYSDSRRSRDRQSEESDTHSEDDSRRKRNRTDDISSKPVEKRYGLQKESDSTRTTKNFLGPNPELLKKKTEKELQERTANLNAVKNKGAVHQLSEEERQERLKAMSNDAVAYDQSRANRHKHTDRVSSTSESNTTVDAKFLQQMRNEVYNSQKTSIEERLKQQRHYTQKSADMESSAGFLSK